jgi:hypothetical protein
LEVDLLIETAERLIPVEIKQTATPLVGHTHGLCRLRQLLGQTAGDPVLVCTASQTDGDARARNRPALVRIPGLAPESQSHQVTGARAGWFLAANRPIGYSS